MIMKKNTINFDNKIIVFEDIDCMTDVIKSRSSPKETVEKMPVDDKVNAKQVLALINNSQKKQINYIVLCEYCMKMMMMN